MFSTGDWYYTEYGGECTAQSRTGGAFTVWRAFLLEGGLAGLRDFPLVLEEIVSRGEFAKFRQGSQGAPGELEFRRKIYSMIEKAGPNAVTGSPSLAATRFFARSCEGVSVDKQATGGDLDKRIRAYIEQTAPQKGKRILDEIEAGLKACHGNVLLRTQLFGYLVELAKVRTDFRDAGMKVVDSLQSAGADREVVMKWLDELSKVPARDAKSAKEGKSGKDAKDAKSAKEKEGKGGRRR